MKKLKEDLKEKFFLNEKDSTDKYFSISFMEDYIAFYDNIDEAIEGLEYNLLDEDLDETFKAQIEHMKKLFKEGKKIIHYVEWGKVISEHWIRRLIWEFFERNQDYVILFEKDDLEISILQDKEYWFSSNYNMRNSRIKNCKNIQKMRKYDWVYND